MSCVHRAPGSPDARVLEVGGLREDDRSRWHLPVEEAMAGIEGDTRLLFVVTPAGERIDVVVVTDADGVKRLGLADLNGPGELSFLSACDAERSRRASSSTKLPPAA